jgi:hypothetical protein
MIATTREGSHDSTEQWKTTVMISRQFHSLYYGNATEIASYVLNQYHANNEQQQQQHSDAAAAAGGYEHYADGAPGFSTSVSSVMRPSSGGWLAGGDSNPEEDLFFVTAAGFNESFGSAMAGNSSAIDPGNLTSFRDDSFSSPYLMPWPQRTSWIVVFAVLVIVAAVGNSLVAWIVFGQLFQITSTILLLHAFIIKDTGDVIAAATAAIVIFHPPTHPHVLAVCKNTHLI